MVSLTRWTWVWTSSGNWWWTGKPGMLQSMGLQRVGGNWATELNHLRKNLSVITKLPWSLKTGIKAKKASHTGQCWFFTWAPWSWKRVNVRNACMPSCPEKDPPYQTTEIWIKAASPTTHACSPMTSYMWSKKKRKENFFLLLLGCLQVYSHSALPVSIVPVRILEIILLTKSSWDSLNFPYFIDNPLQLLWRPWRRCHPHHSKSGRIGEEEGQRTRFLNTFCELDASMEFSLFVDNMITLLCHLVCLLNVPSMEVP